MTTKKTYFQKLKDPRWQKRRLQILERDKWTCQNCHDTEETLHVHHKWYDKGVEPWDYPDDCLVTLCESCHQNESEMFLEYANLFIKTFKRTFFNSDDLRELAWGMRDIKNLTPFRSAMIASAYGWAFSSNEMREIILNHYLARRDDYSIPLPGVYFKDGKSQIYPQAEQKEEISINPLREIKG